VLVARPSIAGKKLAEVENDLMRVLRQARLDLCRRMNIVQFTLIFLIRVYQTRSRRCWRPFWGRRRGAGLRPVVRNTRARRCACTARSSAAGWLCAGWAAAIRGAIAGMDPPEASRPAEIKIANLEAAEIGKTTALSWIVNRSLFWSSPWACISSDPGGGPFFPAQADAGHRADDYQYGIGSGAVPCRQPSDEFVRIRARAGGGRRRSLRRRNRF
jgi:hypothetical protein